VSDDAFFSFADRLEMRRHGSRKHASERFRRQAFGPQIGENGCFFGRFSISPLRGGAELRPSDAFSNGHKTVFVDLAGMGPRGRQPADRV
jgi:hypothetical protein